MDSIDKYIKNYEPGKYKFGRWGGNPDGDSERITDCMEEVYDPFLHRFHQCFRKRGHGYKNLFCKQHSKMYKYLEDEEN